MLMVISKQLEQFFGKIFSDTSCPMNRNEIRYVYESYLLVDKKYKRFDASQFNVFSRLIFQVVC